MQPAPKPDVHSLVLPAKEERDLIRRTLDGDRGAANALVKAYQGPLFGYMLRITGRADVAEDVVQEAFVRALTHLHRYDERFRFSTWLFTIAKRVYVNSRQKLAPVFDSEAAAIGGESQDASRRGSTAHDDYEHNAGDGSTDRAGAALRAALASLSPDQREVVVLFYQVQWPVEQIGEYLDVPVGTVKSHLFRARTKLRTELAENDAVVAWLAEVPA